MAPEAVGSNPIARPSYERKIMKVSIKKLKDLERKITVTVPIKEYETKFTAKLKNIKTKAKVDGLGRAMCQMTFLNKGMVRRYTMK